VLEFPFRSFLPFPITLDQNTTPFRASVGFTFSSRKHQLCSIESDRVSHAFPTRTCRKKCLSVCVFVRVHTRHTLHTHTASLFTYSCVDPYLNFPHTQSYQSIFEIERNQRNKHTLRHTHYDTFTSHYITII
jgi:hypothetical protein